MKIFASKSAPLLLKPTVTDAILIVAEFVMMGFTRYELSRYLDGLREYSRLNPDDMTQARDSALRQGICAFMMSRGMSENFVYPAWLLLCSRTNVWRWLYPDNLAAFPIRWGVIPERVEAARMLADYSEEVLRVADELMLWSLFGAALSRWDMRIQFPGVTLLAAVQNAKMPYDSPPDSSVVNRDVLLLWAASMSGYANVHAKFGGDESFQFGLCYYCKEVARRLCQQGMDQTFSGVSQLAPYYVWPEMRSAGVAEFKASMTEEGPTEQRLLVSRLAGSFVFSGIHQIDTQLVTVNPESWLKSSWRVDISKGGNDVPVF
jgi:hypothetical protein